MPTYDPLDATTPISDGPLIITNPFNDVGDTNHVVAEQRYYVIAGDYLPPALNGGITVGATNCYCVGDFEITDAEAGGIYYTRRWASIPDLRYEYQTYIATHPGIIFQRISFTRSCTSQIELEYFLVGPGRPYATAADIPTVAATGYRYAGDDLDSSADGFFLNFNTTPTLADYLASVSDGDFSIVAEDSSLERYMGNIWARSTRRQKPQ